MLRIKCFLCLMGLLWSFSAAVAQAATSHTVLGDTASEWPGVHYQLLELKRIPPNRLLILLQVIPSAGTPARGVDIIGPMVTVAGGISLPLPFSFDSSTMTETPSGISYPVLPSIAPPGRAYRASKIRATLAPGGKIWVNLQFACPPPPPPPAPGVPPPKQMLSFVFPKGKTPIKLELPPDPTAPAGK
jgi:hypothetical protein